MLTVCYVNNNIININRIINIILNTMVLRIIAKIPIDLPATTCPPTAAVQTEFSAGCRSHSSEAGSVSDPAIQRQIVDNAKHASKHSTLRTLLLFRRRVQQTRYMMAMQCNRATAPITDKGKQ